MKIFERRLWRWLMLGLVAVPVAGCALVPDLLNSQFILAVGLDPATLTQPEGIIIVALNNTTPSPATFRAYYVGDRAQVALSSRNFSVDVEAGEVKNEVLECPVEFIGPGVLTGSGEEISIDAAIAAQVEVTDETTDGTTTTTVDVAYPGPPVETGVAFGCGDVVEIRLSRSLADEEVTYSVTMRVIPGR